MRSLHKVVLLCAALLLPVAVVAQANSGASNVALSATLNETLTITINSGNSQSIASVTPGAVNSFSGGPVNVTTNWILKPGRTAVALYAYFDSATAALAHTDTANTTDIPSGAVKAQLNGAGAFNPLSNVVPYTGAVASGLQVFSNAISGSNKVGNRTDNIALELDLSLTNVNGQNMTQLPADTYTGTLHIQAQATP